MISGVWVYIVSKLKWLIARNEMLELEKRRKQLVDYNKWLNEFPIVHDVLSNMLATYEPQTLTSKAYLNLASLRIRLRSKYKK